MVHLNSVVAISITRMAMYIHVGTTFLEHYNDETCKIALIHRHPKQKRKKRKN